MIVEQFDGRPDRAQIERLANDRERAGDIRRRLSGVFAYLLHQRRTNAIEHVVRRVRGDDFAAQAMSLDRWTEPFAQQGREVEQQVFDEDLRIGQIGFQQILVQHELCVREDHRDLRTRETDVRGAPLGNEVVIGQAFERAIEFAGAFERANESRLLVEHGVAERARDRNGLGLLVVVAQHEVRNFIRHLREQRVARAFGEVVVSDGIVQKDFDVDFVIRRVDAGGVVDGVGVDLAAVHREFDARRLGEAEVRAFADDANTQLVRIDAQHIIRAITGSGVIFVARFHIRADAAEPQQVGARAKNRFDQLCGSERFRWQIEDVLHFIGNRDRLRAPFVNRAAGRQQLFVVRIPSEALIEHPLALGE